MALKQGETPLTTPKIPVAGDKETWIVRLLNRVFNYKIIPNCEKEPYMRRWYIVRTRWFALFLHQFIRSDEDHALHDHPWDFMVLPIWRGYIEHYEEVLSDDGVAKTSIVKQHRAWPFMLRYRPAEWTHRVELIEGKQSWSLFLRFKERRDWGFWNPRSLGVYVWQKWNEFWRDKCE